MTRLILVLSLTFLGCQQPGVSTASAFVGANDLVLVDWLVDGALADGGTESVDRFLFVTSTNTNELRVLNLDSPTAVGARRLAITGPNPLETLSIPVLDRPTGLSLDTRYEEGARRKGSLLYVTRPGGAEFSIVGVELAELRELRRVSTPAPITALTNLMVDAQTSRVWVATFDGEDASVLELVLPASARGLRARTTASLVGALSTRLRVSGASISAMLAVPGLEGRAVNGRPFCANPAKPCLLMATRRLAGAEGTTSLIDPETLEAVPLLFPGPVRSLAISDRAVEGVDGTSPGAVVFGVLDEEACGGSRCGGIAAIDTRRSRPGAPAFGPLQVGGLEPRPLRWSDGLVRGVSIVGGGRVKNVTVEGGIATPGLLGVLTMSNGEIVFFDGLALSLIDQDPAASVIGRGFYSGDPTTWLEGPKIVSGGAKDAELAATLVDGRLRSQTITVTWQGDLTSGVGVPLSGDVGRSFTAPLLAPFTLPGDALVFIGGSSCPAAVVTAVAGDSIQFAPATACGATSVVIRAGAMAPYVVRGSVDGLLGRASSGQSLSAGGLVIPFGIAADTQPPATGVSWSFEVEGALAPMVSRIDTTLFTVANQCPTTPLQLPGAVVYEPVRHRVFLAYPSSNLVAEFDPVRANRGGMGPNEGVVCHR
ncbi:MAG: hypothetical protein JNJ54_22040 [Myxococcaceae bacterium]|nr:hypothetical protein [Myxococcaceae bacterium]